VRWEYRKLALNEHAEKSDDLALLSDAGQDGWELVAILPNNVAYLKRRIATPTDHTPLCGDDIELHAAKVKYLDPATGETWSGRGRMANWLKRKQDAGEDIEKYRV
jgi:hypothetical protein